jgi:hypothetical protein
MNEEKDPKWFVWERTSHGVYNAAIYRGMPIDGSGKTPETERFAFKKKLEADEQQLSLDELKAKYSCPEGAVSTHEPRQKPDLTRNELP